MFSKNGLTYFEDNVVKSADDYWPVYAEFEGHSNDGILRLDANDDGSISYIYSVEGAVNVVNGSAGRDRFYDTEFNETLNLGDGDDHVDLWEGGMIL